jgi:hypothetical protein
MGFVVAVCYQLVPHLWYLYQLAILVPLGGVVYIGMMLLTRAVNAEMREILRKKS